MEREGEVRSRLIKNEQDIEGKVRLTFEFSGWEEAVRWIGRLEKALQEAEA